MLATFSSKMFETEESLVMSSISHCETLTLTSSKKAKNKTVVLREVSVGFGIADIVVVEYTPCPNYGQSLLKHDISVYKTVEGKGKITIGSIVEMTRLSKLQVTNSLDKLCSLGYTIWSDQSTVEFTNKYESTISEVVAIEAKLKDWKRALNQAYRYKWFASKSYVLLDNAHSNAARKNIAAFEEMGVGLMALDQAGNMETLYEPAPVKPIDDRMAMLLSEQVKEYYFNHLTVKLGISSTPLSDNCCSLL